MIQVETRLSFKSQTVAHRFSASRNRIVLFGASGAGKSVLLKMIAGFFNPDSGRIVVDSRVLFDSSAGIDVPVHHRRIGYLPQEYTLFPNLNVIDNILYGIRAQKKKVDQPLLDNLVGRLEIGDLLHRSPGSLSGGEQQRVALARTLIIRPDILLLDEPFTALDIAIRESLRNMVVDLVDELNVPAILVTHDLDEAFVFAREMVLVHRGRVIESGERDTLYLKPQYVETAELMGFTNIFPVSRIEEKEVQLANGDRFHVAGEFVGNRFLCIRPEHIMILREGKAGDDAPANLVSGKIVHVYHHGRYAKVVMSTDSGLSLQISIPVHVYDRLQPDIGGALKVFLKEESIIVCNSIEGDST